MLVFLIIIFLEKRAYNISLIIRVSIQTGIS